MLSLRPEQKAAFEFLQSGAPAFANPLAGDANALVTDMSNMGGMDFGGFDKDIGELAKIGADYGVEEATATANELRAEIAALNLDTVGSGAASAASLVAVQTELVVDQLPNVMSASESHATIKQAMAATPLPPGEGGDEPAQPSEVPTVCDGIRDLMGSLSGAGQAAFDAIKSAVNSLRTAVNNISAAVKGMFTAAYEKFKLAMASIRDAIRDTIRDVVDGVAAIRARVASAIRAALEGVNDLISDAVAGVKSFVNNIGSAVREAISSAASAIKSKINELREMIAAELDKIGKMFDELKNASIALSFPSLSPCAKDVIRAVSGAAGAVALVNLVS